MDDTTMGVQPLAPPSGRFVLRIDPGLHGALRQGARETGMSLNEFCARKLAHPGGKIGGQIGGSASEAVTRAASQVRGFLSHGL
ncbi:toxin-antitoxin system HicB family antitoxin [Gemmatimonadota bacterium]